MKLRYYIWLLILFSCEEQIPWDYISPDEQRIVVEGRITNILKQHSIQLSFNAADPNHGFAPVTGAQVSISYDDTTVLLHENLAGTYLTDSFRAVAGKVYTATIVYGTDTFEASDMMPPISQIQIPLYTNHPKWNNFYSIQDISSDLPAHHSVEIKWQNLAGYDTIPSIQKQALLNFYTLSIYEISKEFAPDKEQYFFPFHASIIIHKYSLSKQHEEFIRSLLMETEWRGGSFDVLYGNVPTNVSNGGLGFFSVSAELVDSFRVQF